MRTGALLAGCVVIGVTVGLLGSPVARADDASFVRDAKALGFVQASDNLISTAQSACYFISLNRDPGQVEQRILRYTRVDSPSQAHQFFVLAVNEYCPQHAAVVGP
ncbi:DUF732 domain-containing protein [Mycobacterium antarcticum]|uniref:DUF732 domain-containing protein n=1 Tax=Mycolicibacterium sp. TUM20984 TaxID=3023368 RepID=UPI00239E6F49|nr:DUF732 domain-containing protein [Mycolicibacterium sp. TUM20984]GLP82994.1 hypothetical protein TUM20984_44140 [Mycolicibacterium sp. TUM20984]